MVPALSLADNVEQLSPIVHQRKIASWLRQQNNWDDGSTLFLLSRSPYSTDFTIRQLGLT